MFFYGIVSMYYHARRIVREDDDEEVARKGYRMVSENGLIDLIMSYVVMPLGMVAICFVGIPTLVCLVFPEKLRGIVQPILCGIEIIGIIIYDIHRIKEEYDFKRGLRQEEAEKKDF